MLLPFYIPFYQRPPNTKARGELVVLLHGIFTTGLRLYRIHKRLVQDGYAVLSITYPSRRFALSNIAEEVAEQISRYRRPEETLSLVGYSMGGLVARAYIKRTDAVQPRAIVCIGTPNQGTEYVDGVLSNPITSLIFRRLAGPPGLEMATKGGVTDTLGPVPEQIKLGVIAGSGGYLLWPRMPGAHDGKVTVERTKVEGMTDHVVIPVTHVAMIHKQSVIDQVAHFLEHERFDHAAEKST